MKFSKRILTFVLTVILAVSAMVIPASAAGSQLYGIGFVKASSLRLRSQPNTTSAVVATASQNECVVILSKEGQWYRVNYNLQEGYMHQDYLDVSVCENAELGLGTISGTGVNLRTGPSTAYSVAAVSSKGDSFYIIGLNNGWLKVIYKETICYIRSDFVTLTEYPYENRASVNSPKFFRRGVSTGVTPSAAALNGSSASALPESTSVTGSQILAEAKKYLGCPYVAGGASPSGFDCSGFVYYVLTQVGIPANRTPAAQMNQGTSVAKSNLQVGDLVFFSSNSGASITHAGIYAGNGQFIHAPNSRSTVSYSNLTSGYWANTYYGACRVC